MYIAKRKYNTSFDLYICGNEKKRDTREWARERERKKQAATVCETSAKIGKKGWEPNNITDEENIDREKNAHCTQDERGNSKQWAQES